MKRMNRIFLVLTLVLGFTIEYVPSLFAQEGDTGEFTLEEITVTAQKREENQQKVPIAMQVISDEEIKELGRSDIDQILQDISSVLINKATDGLRISIRGVANSQDTFKGVSQTGTPTVAINKDGIYSARNESGQNLYDLERVEVLFGPQSTLYGSASPGGVVNIVSAVPKTDKYESSAVLEYGKYDLLRIEGSANVPVSSSFALRAAFATEEREGFLHNGADDIDDKSARLRVMFKPNEKFSFLVTGELDRSLSQGFSGVLPFGNQDEVENPWTAKWDTPGNLNKRKNTKIYANIDLDLGIGTLSLVPSYIKRTTSASSAGLNMFGQYVTGTQAGHTKEKSAELRMISPDDSLFKWIFGAVYYDMKDNNDGERSDGSVNYIYIYRTTKGAYGNITYPVTDRFRVTGGIRYSDESSEGGEYEYPGRPGVPIGWAIASREFTRSDYKIGAEYDISEDSMAYGDMSTSWRAQGLNFHATSVKPPELITSYTIGSKNRFLEDKLQVNVSAYYYNFRNFVGQGGAKYLDFKDLDGDGLYTGTQLWDPDEGRFRNEVVSVDDGGGDPVGKAYMAGMDLQTNFLITNKDKLDLSVSYLKTEIRDLYYDYYDITNQQGIPDQDFSGWSMPSSPELTVTAAYSHNFNLWNGSIITPRIDARYQSSWFLTYTSEMLSMDANTQEIKVFDLSEYRYQEANVIINLAMTYASPDGNWTLNGYVKNMGNYAQKRSLMIQGTDIGAATLSIGSPRTYGAVLSVRF